jgi:hypothetical protein
VKAWPTSRLRHIDKVIQCFHVFRDTLVDDFEHRAGCCVYKSAEESVKLLRYDFPTVKNR